MQTISKAVSGAPLRIALVVVAWVALLPVSVHAQLAATADKPVVSQLLRTGQIERIAPMPSAFVAPREVQVWLPPGYEAQTTSPARSYRVLYLHDGQNLFDTSAVGTEWSVDETAQRLMLAGEIEPMIIVAVSNTADRISEYTP